MEISEKTVELLKDPVLGGGDLDKTVRELIWGEYLRRMAGYQRTNKRLQQKYEMTFGDFLEREMTRALDYTWEVEKDAMAWETAISGIESMQGRLSQLRESKRVPA